MATVSKVMVRAGSAVSKCSPELVSHHYTLHYYYGHTVVGDELDRLLQAPQRAVRALDRELEHEVVALLRFGGAVDHEQHEPQQLAQRDAEGAYRE